MAEVLSRAKKSGKRKNQITSTTTAKTMTPPSSSSSISDVDSHVSHNDDVQVLAPKTKPPRFISNDLISYLHTDNLTGLMIRTRAFTKYFHETFRAFQNEVLSYRSMMDRDHAKSENFLESCAIQLESEGMMIRTVLNNFSVRMENYQDLLMKMPFPPRDTIRVNHPLNAFSPDDISSAIQRLKKKIVLPNGMIFDAEKMTMLVEEVQLDKIQPILEVEENIVEVPTPLGDYSVEASEAKRKREEQSKMFEGKKILEAKDGVIKMSYSTYHFKVMQILAVNGFFGPMYVKYQKKHQKVIFQLIAGKHGENFVETMVAYLQASYAAYETIFKEGARSVFGPADVEGDVAQHLAQFFHFFKLQVSDTPLLS